MSSSNLVKVTYAKEAEYGKKNDPISAEVMETARFTTESLSGTPETTQSAELRSDRMSSGQVVTGLDVGGAINYELSRDTFFDDFFEAGMMSAWVPKNEVSTTVTLTPNPSNDQEADMVLGLDLTGAAVGDVLQIRSNGGSVPNFLVQIISIDVADTEFTVATERGQQALSAEASFVSVPSYVEIGATKSSFTISKAYTDVVHDVTTDEHSQTYLGELVSGFNVNASYGEIVTGSFETLGNGYIQEYPSYSQQVVTGGGTVNPAGTSNPLNASIDMPIQTVDGVATTYCIESIGITLDNGLTPQNCIGYAAPNDYALGTADIAITMDVYNTDNSYDALQPKKLSQEPISVMFSAENLDGGYAFSLTAIQLTFPDPAAEGQNEQVMINATGTAKVGPNGASSLRIYQLEV